jgi:asparagine synthase (glutamine-hydrolysing)
LNKKALLEYFTFQNIFTDQTLLEDVHLLPAGHFAKLHVTTGQWSQHQYWDYRFREPDHKADKQEYVEELDRLFKQAVNRQLVGDVEMGAYLSGGMDSGSITAIAAMQFQYLKTFT